MHIVICAKQVLDPEGVNGYALWGRLQVDESGRAFVTSGAVPHILNAYDEQATEAALRIRDDGVECRITAIAVGGDSAPDVLKRCVAMGADDAIHVVDADAAAADGFRTARLLSTAVQELGDVELVLCGRQGSDYDQGTVPAVMAELLDSAYVTMAADVRMDGDGVRVTRATPLGEEVVRASLPAVVTVSNELGQARYPSSRGMMAARRNPPLVKEAAALLDGEGEHAVEVAQLFVPDVQGHCEMIEGETPQASAQVLMRRLEETGVLSE